MDCAAAGPLLAAHGDGALGPVDRAVVQGHLATCDNCRDLAATMRWCTGTAVAALAAASLAVARRRRREAGHASAERLVSEANASAVRRSARMG